MLYKLKLPHQRHDIIAGKGRPMRTMAIIQTGGKSFFTWSTKKSYFAMTQCAKVFAIVHMSRVSPQTHNITQINIVYVRTLKTECGGSINERVLLPRKQYNKKWSMSDINCLWRVFKMLQTRFLSLIDHPPQDQDRIRKYGPADLLSLWYK